MFFANREEIEHIYQEYPAHKKEHVNNISSKDFGRDFKAF
jgi:hypothetical protein